MDELVRTLRYYISRDLVFLVSGSSVVATFFYVSTDSPWIEIGHWPGVVLAAGIGYVIGYTLQEIASIAGLVTTAPIREAGWFMEEVYERFNSRPWEAITKEMKLLYETQGEYERASAKGDAPDYERLVMLMQIGTSGGPCALICTVLLALKSQHSLALASLLLGMSLILVGRLKAMQLARFLAEGPHVRPCEK